ncbi:MAG TPA: hypothetical protein VGW57_09360 [Chthoniobacterales bacterium]|nr:hypothetical protein [Chthoniobacterales bacterium]
MELPTKTDIWKLQEQASGPMTPYQVYAMVGHTLFNLHQLEALLKLAAGVLQEAAKGGEGEIDAEQSILEMRRDSLGRLLRNVRKVVNVDPGFSRVMTRLLRRRNALAHKLAAHTPFHPSSKEWVRNVPRFLWALEHDLEAVHYVFRRYLQCYLLQHANDPEAILAENEVATFMRFKADSRPVV